MNSNLRIGLFGGSFDPVHNGHLRLAEFAKKEFKLDKVVFIPAYDPPHRKQKKLSPPAARLKMLSLAAGRKPGFEISRYELNKKRPVYTYRMLEHFSKEFRGSTLFFIAGSDSLADMKHWKRPGRILELAEVITGVRKGSVKPKRSAGGRIHVLSRPIPRVSSTGIRELAAKGAPLKGLVPPAVASYIRKHDIY